MENKNPQSKTKKFRIFRRNKATDKDSTEFHKEPPKKLTISREIRDRISAASMDLFELNYLADPISPYQKLSRKVQDNHFIIQGLLQLKEAIIKSIEHIDSLLRRDESPFSIFIELLSFYTIISEIDEIDLGFHLMNATTMPDTEEICSLICKTYYLHIVLSKKIALLSKKIDWNDKRVPVEQGPNWQSLHSEGAHFIIDKLNIEQKESYLKRFIGKVTYFRIDLSRVYRTGKQMAKLSPIVYQWDLKRHQKNILSQQDDFMRNN